ncbi:MAG: DUF4136 domain-containing protein [Deltaproteobacteria bacterium]|nr:DUF4136 domain-containing protein [Deltaproteobacteria bacterium]
MRLKNSDFRFGLAAAVILAAMILVGCSPSIKYSYDARTNFPELKTYQWAAPVGVYRLDPLLETNVQFLVDRDLGKKGLTRKTDQADLLIWMNYEAEYDKAYQLRMLTLNIARSDTREIIWRGTATGELKTDAASKKLEETVAGLLSSFPPK